MVPPDPETLAAIRTEIEKQEKSVAARAHK